MKSSKERGHLIQFLDYNKLIPSQSSLYKLIERDEKGLSINNDDWGKCVSTQQLSRVSSMVFWDSDRKDNVRPIPPPSKKRKLIGDNTIARDIFVRWDLENKMGWKGCIRLCVERIKFSDMQSTARPLLSCFDFYSLLDICSYIGSSDIYHGKKFDCDKFHRRNERYCRLYFDPQSFPHLHQRFGKVAIFPSLTN